MLINQIAYFTVLMSEIAEEVIREFLKYVCQRISWFLFRKFHRLINSRFSPATKKM